MKILIIKPSSLGDIVHALPTVNLIRQAYPEAHLAWLINDTFASLLQHSPLLNEVIEFPRASLGRMTQIPKLLSFCRQLKQRKFDVVLDLQGLFRSGWLCHKTSAPRRMGLSDAREGAGLFYTEKIKIPEAPIHSVDRYLLSLDAFGIGNRRIEFPLPIVDPAVEWVKSFLSGHRIPSGTCLIAVQSSARRAEKRWPAERFAALLGKLVRAYPLAKIVLLGSAADEELACQIISLTQPPNYSGIINTAGQTTLPQLVALLRQSRLLITNDSGPLHLAAALGKPLVALFGPTDPVRVGPYSTDPDRSPFTVISAKGPIHNIPVEQVLDAVTLRLQK